MCIQLIQLHICSPRREAADSLCVLSASGSHQERRLLGTRVAHVRAESRSTAAFSWIPRAFELMLKVLILLLSSGNLAMCVLRR